MRAWRAAMVGLASTACLLAACGKAGPTVQGPLAGPPGDPAATRYRLLETTPACPPTTCTALAGTAAIERGNFACFGVVDGPTDAGEVVLSLNGTNFGGNVTAVTIVDGQLTITATVVNEIEGGSHVVTIRMALLSATAVQELVIDGTAYPLTTDSNVSGAVGDCDVPPLPCLA